ncbi:MAG: hypothetical protein HN909_08090 [Phycisphaerales bacterium]|jgi:hypothetical protein|nr:hypothetical protein [Phycisphaerales bacterium]MBT7171715.1 hypothetical protein [Phycisphaerales bacterium]
MEKSIPSSMFAIAALVLLACAAVRFFMITGAVVGTFLDQEMVLLFGGTLISGLSIVAGGLYPEEYAKRSAAFVCMMYMAAFTVLSVTATI